MARVLLDCLLLTQNGYLSIAELQQMEWQRMNHLRFLFMRLLNLTAELKNFMQIFILIQFARLVLLLKMI